MKSRSPWIHGMTWFVVLVAVCVGPAAAEIIVANFDGGNSTEVVDAWTGMAGNGWASPWGVSGNEGYYTATVISSGDAGFSELKEDMGSYLKVTANASATQSFRASVGRDYKGVSGIDWTAQHKIEFTLRIDEDFAAGSFTDFNDRYSIYDRATVNSATGNTDRWCIHGMSNVDETHAYHAFAGKWVFYDNPGDTGTLWNETSLVDTGIHLATDHVYDFTIVVNPDSETYDATLVDVTADLTFTATNLNWRRRGSGVGGVINFQGYDVYTTSGDRAFSLDGLSITQIPEPSTFLLLISALAISAALRSRRP